MLQNSGVREYFGDYLCFRFLVLGNISGDFNVFNGIWLGYIWKLAIKVLRLCFTSRWKLAIKFLSAITSRWSLGFSVCA
jgi:hypothetical protein